MFYSCTLCWVKQAEQVNALVATEEAGAVFEESMC